jgi:quercetin dioxygenase-like cupin family protein
MKIIQMSEVIKEPFSNNLFTGPGVTRQPLTPGSTDFNMNIVNFSKGVKNKLHTHESDQVLIVTSGTGIIATEMEEHTVTTGHVALIPAGERHWHGATEESTFAHIALSLVGSKTIPVKE